MRESWADDRLDDFRSEVNRRFDRVEEELGSVKNHLGRIDGRIDDLHGTINDLHRTMLLLGASAITTIVVGFLGLILTHA